MRHRERLNRPYEMKLLAVSYVSRTMREEKLYLSDIKEAIDKIYLYTNGLTIEGFEKDQMVVERLISDL